MEPETLTAVAAIAGAVGTPVVAIWLAKINRQNLRDQRKADDARAERHRAHDLQSQLRERRASLADMQVARLHEDATEFVTVLDEAWRALADMQGSYWAAGLLYVPSRDAENFEERAARRKAFLKDANAGWSKRNIEPRLAAAQAKLSLFGGAVAAVAEQSRERALQQRVNLRQWWHEHGLRNDIDTPPQRSISGEADDEIAAFIEVVRRAEQEILSPTVEASLPEPRQSVDET